LTKKKIRPPKLVSIVVVAALLFSTLAMTTIETPTANANSTPSVIQTSIGLIDSRELETFVDTESRELTESACEAAIISSKTALFAR
jgi:hypothetical protein